MENPFNLFLDSINFGKINDGNFIVFFNKVNGNLFKVEKNTVDGFIDSYIFKKRSPLDIDKQLMKLFKMGEVSGEKVDPSPFHIQWHINDNCNLRCKHCYMEEYVDKGLSLDSMKKIVNKYFRAIEKWNHSPEFSITGGEPLMNPNLFPLIDYIRNKNPSSRIAILTNGTLLNKEIVSKIKDRKLSLVQVSLEGSTGEINDNIRGVGNFDKVIGAINLLKKSKIKTSLHFVISKQNFKDVKNYINLAKELEIDMLTFSTLVPFGNGGQMKKLILSPIELKKCYEEIDEIAQVLDLNGQKPYIRRTRPLWCDFKTVNPERPVGGVCPVGLNTLTILANGEVMPCRRLPRIIGDLKKQNFFEIWYGSEILWKIRNRSNLKGCKSCKYLEKCAGCRGIAEVYHGDYMAGDPQCWLINNNLGDNAKIDN
jgi:AdoMet-dependent heme synthase